MPKPKTEAEKRAQKKYMSGYIELKIRMTPEQRDIIQEHAAKMGESTSAFINRAIDEAMGGE